MQKTETRADGSISSGIGVISGLNELLLLVAPQLLTGSL